MNPRRIPKPSEVAVLIESVASRTPTDIYALASILADEVNRSVIVSALFAASKEAAP